MFILLLLRLLVTFAVQVPSSATDIASDDADTPLTAPTFNVLIYEVSNVATLVVRAVKFVSNVSILATASCKALVNNGITSV